MTSSTDGIEGPSAPADLPDAASSVPEMVERVIQRHQREIEAFTRVGWLAKGIVYVLFGVSAVAIARQSAPSDEASPQGALGQVMDAPAGRLVLAVVAVGLLLYAFWRAVSVILVDGDDLHAWGDRLGYSLSAVVYVSLGLTAATSAWNGIEPAKSSRIESMSQALLENGVGRWALGLAGVATIGVGAYFVVRKGVMRGFVDNLAGVTEDGGAHDGIDHQIWIGGIVGWIGRGVVTALVGYFVVQAAVKFDSTEARGFDRALREATTTTTGAALVWVSAIGLISYGVFCVISHRRRTLGDR